MRAVFHSLPSGETLRWLPSGETFRWLPSGETIRWPPSGAVFQPYPRREPRGFSLLEVLIVVTIISAIATIAIPNLLNAIDRSRQSSTVADIRTIGSALEHYAVDHLSYPTGDIEILRRELEPDYLKQLPARDGWGHLFVFEAGDQGSSYILRSLGKDGALQETDLVEVTRDFAADIVLVDGVFVQRPAGKQGKAELETASQT